VQQDQLDISQESGDEQQDQSQPKLIVFLCLRDCECLCQHAACVLSTYEEDGAHGISLVNHARAQ
jgi:hypothetical protein